MVMVGLTQRSKNSVVGAYTAVKGVLVPHEPWPLPERCVRQVSKEQCGVV